MKKRDKTEEEMPRAVALPGHGLADEGAEPSLRGVGNEAGLETARGDAADPVETYTEDLDDDEAAEVKAELRSLQGRITRDEA